MLFFGREQVQPRGDDSLHRFRNRKLFTVAAFRVHLRVLLGVERIAARVGEQPLLDFGFEHRLAE